MSAAATALHLGSWLGHAKLCKLLQPNSSCSPVWHRPVHNIKPDALEPFHDMIQDQLSQSAVIRSRVSFQNGPTVAMSTASSGECAPWIVGPYDTMSSCPPSLSFSMPHCTVVRRQGDDVLANTGKRTLRDFDRLSWSRQDRMAHASQTACSCVT